MRVPVMLVVGGKEQQSGEVAVRRRHSDGRRTMVVSELAGEMLDETAAKA